MNVVAPLRRIPLHRSLVRPILLGGAERELVIMNMTFVFALIFGVGLTKLTIIAALILGVGGQFVLLMMGKYDPLLSRVYLRFDENRIKNAKRTSIKSRRYLRFT